VVEDGWTASFAAAVFNVSWPTANKWPDRYRSGGSAAMDDRSSRTHRCPRRTWTLPTRPLSPEVTVRSVGTVWARDLVFKLDDQTARG
jgi:transposase